MAKVFVLSILLICFLQPKQQAIASTVNESKDGSVMLVTIPPNSQRAEIIKRFLSREKTVIKPISTTTRKPKEEEIDGADYWFIKSRDYNKMEKSKQFFKNTNISGFKYGILANDITPLLDSGYDIIIDITAKSAIEMKKEMKKKNIKTTLICFVPKSIAKISGSKKNKLLAKRIDQWIKEIDLCRKFDYFIIESNIEKSVDLLTTIYHELVLQRKSNLEEKKHAKNLYNEYIELQKMKTQ